MYQFIPGQRPVDMGGIKGSPMYSVAIGDGTNNHRNEVYGANKNGGIYLFWWNDRVAP
jgi:hypothetical protein